MSDKPESILGAQHVSKGARREDSEDAGVDHEELKELQNRMQTASVTHQNEEVRLELRNWASELEDLLDAE